MTPLEHIPEAMPSLSMAVVIPAYKVKRHVLDVIRLIGPEVCRIYVIDDACPEQTGQWVQQHCTDARVTVLFHEKNRGVGGAVMSGYRQALLDCVDIVIKVDGDGQMDPGLIPDFAAPIVAGLADYTKGNRFYDLEGLQSMPMVRLLGNAVLSFISKASSGYWNVFDPTNGYTAIHRHVLQRLPLKKISQRYFFESDILFRLNTMRAVVLDVPMDACYGDENSSLNIKRVLPEFFTKHTKNFFKRIFYNYYLRDMSVASFELPLGLALLAFGFVFGLVHWHESAVQNVATPAGTVILAALPIILGAQLFIAFLTHDTSQVPVRVLHRSEARQTGKRGQV